VLLLDLGMLGNNVFVAVKTFFHWRNSRVDGTTHIRMTKLALNLFDPCMDAVAKRDGLLWADVHRWRNIEIIEKTDYEKDAAPGEEQWALVHLHGIEKVRNRGGVFH
jgi:hypothetical protein